MPHIFENGIPNTILAMVCATLLALKTPCLRATVALKNALDIRLVISQRRFGIERSLLTVLLPRRWMEGCTVCFTLTIGDGPRTFQGSRLSSCGRERGSYATVGTDDGDQGWRSVEVPGPCRRSSDAISPEKPTASCHKRYSHLLLNQNAAVTPRIC